MRVNIVLACLSVLILAAAIYYRATNSDRHEAARKRFPFESLTARLPKGRPITANKPLSAEAAKHWNEIERVLAYGSDRAEMLQALHERTRDIFVARPGAGNETPEHLLMDTSEDPAPPRQPGEPAAFPLSPGDAVIRVQPNDDLREWHRYGVLAFLPARSFGFARDRDHVAGFSPHGFRFAFPQRPLRLENVQLVGILTHAQPVVYLTENLPNMEQVRRVKKRALDLFEDAGLSSLREGEDMYIIQKDDTLRMLGALRATKTCQKCHDAEIGDLLGAFSYTLRPRPMEENTP